MADTDTLLQDIVAPSKQRGFLYQGLEIYLPAPRTARQAGGGLALPNF